MINLIKQKVADYKKKKAEKAQLKKMQEYYKYLQMGAMFLQYINKDLEKQTQKKLNRHQRRRWEKEISKKGKFSPEMIQHYAQNVDAVLEYMKTQKTKRKK